MSCLRPLEAYRARNGDVKIGRGGSFAVESFELPCGRCIGCKMDRARSWAIRITHEAQLYSNNWFATFTYSDDNLPTARTLQYRDYQCFMKRYRWEKLRGKRKRVYRRGFSPGPKGNYPLRFFVAGEYGSKRRRPHFHAILFNVVFGDEVAWMNGSFQSATLERLWKLGNVQLDPVNAQTAAYVAGYCLKKVYGSQAGVAYDVVDRVTGEVVRRVPEFVRMSLKPGIGFWWYEKYKKDLFPHDFAVMDGKRWKVPRFYWDKFCGEAERVSVEELEYARYLRACQFRAEGTPERRAVREEYALARNAFYGEREDL